MTDTLASYTAIGTYAEFAEKKGNFKNWYVSRCRSVIGKLKTNNDRIKKAKAVDIICEGEIIFL